MSKVTINMMMLINVKNVEIGNIIMIGYDQVEVVEVEHFHNDITGVPMVRLWGQDVMYDFVYGDQVKLVKE